jgi:catechol 1,2-dioxygenase
VLLLLSNVGGLTVSPTERRPCKSFDLASFLFFFSLFPILPRPANRYLLNTGKISGPERNEMILISDVLGLEALIDTMTTERFHREHRLRAEAKAETESTASGGLETATLSAILGPFYREGAPRYENGESIVKTHHPDDVSAYLYGRVVDIHNRPIVGAEVT